MGRRRALITGAGSGIGRALAASLAARGDEVFIVDVDSERAAATGGQLGARWMAGDVGDPALFHELSGEFPDPHLVCLNAGVVGRAVGAPWEVPTDDWDRVFSVNVRGVLNGLSEYVPRLVAADEPRSVLITGSLAGLVAFPSGGAYAASKHAVAAIAEQTAMSLADTKVRVTLLCPALVRTAMSDAGIEPEVVAAEALDAVARGAFAVVPAEWHSAVRYRASLLVEGRQPTAPMPDEDN